jgi:hypothetical protein
MVGTKQDKLGLTKDGKSLICPICPLLLAQQGKSRGDCSSPVRFHQNGGYLNCRGGGYGTPCSQYGQ